MTRIVVTGKSGQVVSALRELSEGTDIDLVAIGRPEIDLADPGSFDATVRAVKPEAIFSVAAFTQVDEAESRPDLVHAVNALSPGRLALIAADLGIPILHLSTDYVFGGEKPGPYSEEDETGPVSVYGRSKLAGEMAVFEGTSNHVILRTAWVYSPFGTNFVKTMLGLAQTKDAVSVVADQRGSPTSALDIALVMLLIARRVLADPAPNLRGTFHLAARGEATRAEFAEAIFAGLRARTGRAVVVNPIATADYPTSARRPANSRLNCEKLLRAYGLELDPWPISLETCLDRLIGPHGDRHL